ncbi:MAG: hypothetical protein CLLPBCKN_004132 [Chroococcidiopsis cubana SAG 39.79]|nr:hypothetical protein [Chroococcidiopsis cubana SAG 39.79]
MEVLLMKFGGIRAVETLHVTSLQGEDKTKIKSTI